MTATIHQIRQHQRELSADLAAVILAERTAMVLACGESKSRHHRAEIIRAAAVGDMGRIINALKGWTDDQ